MAGRRGARIKLTERQIDIMAEFIEKGHRINHALQKMGIPKATYYLWVKRAENIRDGKEFVNLPKREKEKLLYFLKKMNDAKFSNIDFHVENLHKHAEKNPNISLKLLELEKEYRVEQKVKQHITGSVSFNMEDLNKAWRKQKK